MYPEIDSNGGNVIAGEKSSIPEADKHAGLSNAAVTEQHHLEMIILYVNDLLNGIYVNIYQPDNK